MAEFPYTQSPGNIKKLFDLIQDVGKPTKVNIPFMTSIGLKSKNDRRLPDLLKFLGFIDSSGVPTPIWMEYRNKSKAPVVLAQAIRAGYSTLFGMYPDAHRRDDEVLRNFFNSNTSVGSSIVSVMVSTFKAVIALADFNADVPEDVEEEVAEVAAQNEQRKMKSNPNIGIGNGNGSSGLAVTVNIQLQIPATDDAAVYDKFFESLYKHVLSKDKEQ